MDTITLRVISLEKFSVANWALFVPEFSIRTFSDLSQNERIRSGNKRIPYLRRFILHPEYADVYVPKVEVYEKADNTKGIVWYEAVISFSLPKIVFENSILEAFESDIPTTMSIVSQRLASIGIRISEHTILESPLSVVHFCKNTLLPSQIYLRAILNEFSHINMGEAYQTTEDIRNRDKNNSSVLHLYCGSREWSFYEKIRDSTKKAGREKEFVERYGLQNTELFRYEYRLNKAQTIRSEINKLLDRPFITPVLVKDLASPDLCSKVLLNSWHKIIQRPENQLALIGHNNGLQLLLHILQKGKDANAHSQNKALWSYGLAMAIKNHGAKAIREELKRIWSTKANSR
ncbi:MAG: hypothetical protein AAB611_02895, partial [Patescibacteria group bacterium]